MYEYGVVIIFFLLNWYKGEVGKLEMKCRMKNTRKLKYFLMLLFFDICAKKYKNKNEIGNRMKEARMCQRDVMLCVTSYR